MQSAPTPIAIAVVEHGGCFLVGQRPEGRPLAGYAEFPGGRVEDGEAAAAAAIRECLEETGVPVEVVGEYRDCFYEYTHDHLHLRFFACRPLPPIQPAHPPFRWVSRDDLTALQFPKANASLVNHLLAGRGASGP